MALPHKPAMYDGRMLSEGKENPLPVGGVGGTRLSTLIAISEPSMNATMERNELNRKPIQCEQVYVCVPEMNAVQQ